MILSRARRRTVTCGGNRTGIRSSQGGDRWSRAGDRASGEWPKRRPMPEEAPPRMCISYCHDSPARQDRLLALADRLHGEGVGGAEKVLRPIRRRRIGLLAAAGAGAGMLLAGPAIADPSPAAAITECDRLAADPGDPNREGPGVPLDKIDAPSAIPRGGQALAPQP